MNVQEQIAQYLDHLEDWNYVEAILNATDLQTLFATITLILCSRNEDNIKGANLFLRDVVLLAPEQISQNFKANFPPQTIIKALEDNVFANNWFVRSDSVCTLGKLGLTMSIPTLVKAFNQSIETDPLLLPELFFELSWLQGESDWALLSKALHSHHYLSRWAALPEIGRHFVDPGKIEGFSQQKELVKSMLDDLNGYVKQEAQYEYQRLLYLQKAKGASRKEKKQLKRELDQYEPPVMFMDVEIQFGNYLYNSSQRDYQLSELEDFVDRLLVSPRKRAHQAR